MLGRDVGRERGRKMYEPELVNKKKVKKSLGTTGKLVPRPLQPMKKREKRNSELERAKKNEGK